MKEIVGKPIFIGLTLVIVLFVLCVFVTIPMYDGVFSYDKGLVHVQHEGRVALSYFFGTGLEHAEFLGIQPSSFELKGIGYVLFALIHFGVPFLVAYRVYLGKARKRLLENKED